MNTPIFDFVSSYSKTDPLRLHMPGHKGKKVLGCEAFDITEISGADVLYSDSGIIMESQKNASRLFGSKITFYSTEGSSLCIRAMLLLAKKAALLQGKNPLIAAARNAHKTFLTACALLDLDPIWIPSKNQKDLYSSNLTAEDLLAFLESDAEKPTALWITSPNYLGEIADIKALAQICHAQGILLLVDNAHGAYLNFLPESAHPLALGADLVCDSAHKTLPVLTGGAYLHLSKSIPESLLLQARNSLELFASTSPSYLILSSLDLCNHYLSEDYPQILNPFAAKVHDFKKELKASGYALLGNEPLKITIQTKPYGYLGTEIQKILQEKEIFIELADPDYIVMMLTPEIGDRGLQKIRSALLEIPPKEPILIFPPKIKCGRKIYSPREAIFSNSKRIPVSQCLGKILAEPGVACPPAIPIAVCGEELLEDHIKAFEYYGITSLAVID